MNANAQYEVAGGAGNRRAVEWPRPLRALAVAHLVAMSSVFSLASAAQEPVTETLDMNDAGDSPAAFIAFLKQWKGGIVDVTADFSGAETLTITGYKERNTNQYFRIIENGAITHVSIVAQDVAAFMAETVDRQKANFRSDVFKLNHADVGSIYPLIETFIGGDEHTTIAFDPDSNVIVARGPSEVLSLIQNAINRLDQPRESERSKNIEFVAYIVEAGDGEVDSSAIPPVLEPVVRELQSSFVYKQYRLLDTLVLRTREGREARLSGSLPAMSHTGVGTYELRFKRTRVSEEPGGHLIQFDDLSLSGQFRRLPPPPPPQGSQARPAPTRVTRPAVSNLGDQFSISVNVDVREGQIVVVGKSSMQGAQKAIFFVLTAKVVD